MEESSRENETPQARPPQPPPLVWDPPGAGEKLTDSHGTTHSMGDSRVPPPPLPRHEETSSRHAPQVRLTMGYTGPEAAPTVPALPPAPAPSPPTVRKKAAKAKRTGKRMGLAEAACWTGLSLALAGSLLGNALLSAGWKADVAVKEKRWREIDRLRQATRSAHAINSQGLDALHPLMIRTHLSVIDKQAELRDQKQLEMELKANIVVLEQQLMDAGLMPRAPIPETWPNGELDALLDNNPLVPR